MCTTATTAKNLKNKIGINNSTITQGGRPSEVNQSPINNDSHSSHITETDEEISAINYTNQGNRAGSSVMIGNVSPLETPDSNFKNSEGDPKSTLGLLKANNADRPIIGHLNINFLEPKFDQLKSLVKDNVDILMISETKLDDTFPNGQFLIEGYSEPIRLDRNCHGGGIMFFARDDLPCHEIKSHNPPSDIEGIFLEVTIRKSKWLIFGGYNPHKDKISYFFR